MEELDIAAVKKRSIHGIFALTTRTFFIQIISFIVNFFLTIFLAPSIFGVYFIVSAVIAFLSYFSDIGLAAALIQKKEALNDRDLKTTFTIQQVLVLTVCGIALLCSSYIAKFYDLQPAGFQLFQALIIAFFLSSLKTIPSVILERNLNFEKLVIPQIVESLFFNVTALLLAINGFGISSFTYAVLARGISGVIVIYIISPWRISLGFSKDTAKKLLSFGIPFQLNSFLALVKDDLLMAYIGKVLPLAQVGYIGFAQKWALAPLRLIMDNIIRITFPSFARLQHDKDSLKKGIEKSLFILSFVIFPSLTGLVILAPYFIQIIPKYQKWEPSILSLGLFAINAGLSSISTPLTNALNAIGKIKITLYLMIFWVIVTWVLTPISIMWFGFNGFAGASALISTSVVLVVYITRKYINFSILPIITPIIGSIILGFILFYASHMLIMNLLNIFMLIIVGSILYLSVVFLLARKEIIQDINLVKRQFVKTK